MFDCGRFYHQPLFESTKKWRDRSGDTEDNGSKVAATTQLTQLFYNKKAAVRDGCAAFGWV